MGFTFTTGFWSCFVYGALYFLPVFVMTFAAGGTVEVIFACVRGHEINEGFFVTGFLLPLTLPPTIPLWQVASGAIFGVLIVAVHCRAAAPTLSVRCGTLSVLKLPCRRRRCSRQLIRLGQRWCSRSQV